MLFQISIRPDYPAFLLPGWALDPRLLDTN